MGGAVVMGDAAAPPPASAATYWRELDPSFSPVPLEWMEVDDLEDHQLDIVVSDYSEAFVSCARNSDMAGVEAVLEEMRSIGVLPDTNTYKAAMKACGKSWQNAVHLLRLSESHACLDPSAPAATFEAEDDADDALSVPLESSPYNPRLLLSAMKACSRAGEHEQALILAAERVDGQAGTTPKKVLDAVVSCYRSSGLWHEAVDLLDLMLYSGRPPSPANVNMVMEACLDARKEHVALRALRRYTDAGLCPGKRTYLLGIKAACRVGDVDEAVRLADDMEERHPGADACFKESLAAAAELYAAYYGPANLFQLQEGLNHVRDLHRQLILGRRNTKAWSLPADPRSYVSLVQAYSKLRAYDDANAIYQEMQERFHGYTGGL